MTHEENVSSMKKSQQEIEQQREINGFYIKIDKSLLFLKKTFKR